MACVLTTVVETPTFLRGAASLLSDSERDELVTYVATNPERGDVMTGAGGVRKLRWAAKGQGKRGGVRVIYYYHDDSVPLFLLSVFAKSAKVNLTQRERNEMKKLVPHLAAGYTRRNAK